MRASEKAWRFGDLLELSSTDINEISAITHSPTHQCSSHILKNWKMNSSGIMTHLGQQHKFQMQASARLLLQSKTVALKCITKKESQFGKLQIREKDSADMLKARQKITPNTENGIIVGKKWKVWNHNVENHPQLFRNCNFFLKIGSNWFFESVDSGNNLYQSFSPWNVKQYQLFEVTFVIHFEKCTVHHAETIWWCPRYFTCGCHACS